MVKLHGAKNQEDAIVILQVFMDTDNREHDFVHFSELVDVMVFGVPDGKNKEVHLGLQGLLAGHYSVEHQGDPSFAVSGLKKLN